MLAVAGVGAAVVAATSSADTAVRPVGVKPLGPATTDDWSIGPRGVLATAADRTRILVHLTRGSGADRTPALTGDFDGSGGGEARLVTCTAPPRRWTVGIGRQQTITLRCDTRVDPGVVEQMLFVHAGPR